jgi:hypothetical protein
MLLQKFVLVFLVFFLKSSSIHTWAFGHATIFLTSNIIYFLFPQVPLVNMKVIFIKVKTY